MRPSHSFTLSRSVETLFDKTFLPPFPFHTSAGGCSQTYSTDQLGTKDVKTKECERVHLLTHDHFPKKMAVTPFDPPLPDNNPTAHANLMALSFIEQEL